MSEVLVVGRSGKKKRSIRKKKRRGFSRTSQVSFSRKDLRRSGVFARERNLQDKRAVVKARLFSGRLSSLHKMTHGWVNKASPPRHQIHRATPPSPRVASHREKVPEPESASASRAHHTARVDHRRRRDQRRIASSLTHRSTRQERPSLTRKQLGQRRDRHRQTSNAHPHDDGEPIERGGRRAGRRASRRRASRERRTRAGRRRACRPRRFKGVATIRRRLAGARRASPRARGIGP